MTSPQETAVQLAVLKVLEKQLKTAQTTAAAALTSGWTIGDRITGKLGDGPVIGSVTYKKGAAGASVTDRTAFEEWVKKTHPTEWETVTPPPSSRVNPAFEARLVSAAKQLGAPVDAETGEEVPGITVSTGKAGPMVVLAPDATEVVAAGWSAGGLADVVGALIRPAIATGQI